MLCIYCGSLATERDHLVARIFRKSMGPALFCQKANHIKTAPACRECNRTLGNYPLSDVRKRASFLIEKYGQSINDERQAWLKAVAFPFD